MRRTLLLLLGNLFLSLPIFPLRIAPKGKVEVVEAAGKEGKILSSLLSLEGELWISSEETMFYGDGLLEVDALADRTDSQVREAWFDYRAGWFSFRVGRQIVAWGEADGVRITDVLSSRDFHSLYQDDTLAIDALRLTGSWGSYSFDCYWIPIFRAARLPEDDNPLAGLDAYRILSLLDRKEPERNLAHGSYAVRLASRTSLVDYALYGYWGYNDLPVVDIGRGMAVYERMGMVGFDADMPVGSFVLRMESAWYPWQALQRKDLGGSERRNQVQALAGMDWMQGGWSLTLQYAGDLVLGKTAGLEHERYEHKATLSLARTICDDLLDLSLEAAAGLNDLDSVWHASMAYDVTDGFAIEGGWYLFLEGPEKKGTYGAYRDYSMAYAKATYQF